MMNFSKKIMMAAAMIAAVSTSGLVLAERCQSCAEKLAIKQSIKDAVAAALAAVKPSKDKEVEKCGCSKPRPPHRDADSDEYGYDAQEYQAIAGEEAQEGQDKAVVFTQDRCSEASLCSLHSQLQDMSCDNAECCKRIYDRLKRQGREARRCCSRIRNDIEDVQELVLSQTDQAADCCSVIEARIGDLCNSSVIDTPPSFSIVEVVDASCLDMLTWLKSIYALVAQIWFCTCDIP